MQRSESPKLTILASEIANSKKIAEGQDGITYRCLYMGSDDTIKNKICQRINVGTAEEPEYVYYLVLKLYHDSVSPEKEQSIANYLFTKKGEYTPACAVEYIDGTTKRQALISQFQAMETVVKDDQSLEFSGGDLHGLFKDVSANLAKTEFISGASNDSTLGSEYIKAFEEDLDITIAQLVYSAYQSLISLHKNGVIHNDTAFRNFLAKATKKDPNTNILELFSAVIIDYGRSQMMDANGKCEVTEEIMPLKWLSYAMLINREGSAQSDLYAFRICLFEAISVLMGGKLDYYFQQIVRDPEKADGSMPGNVAAFVGTRGDDYALSKYVQHASDLSVSSKPAERFLKSFIPYLTPPDKKPVSQLKTVDDEAIFKKCYEEHFEQLLLAKYQLLQVRLASNHFPRQQAFQSFFTSIRKLRQPPIAELNRTDDLFKLFEKIADGPQDESALGDITQLGKLLEPSERKQLVAEAFTAINEYQDSYDRVMVLLQSESISLADLSFIPPDFYDVQRKRLVDIRDALAVMNTKVKDEAVQKAYAQLEEKIKIVEQDGPLWGELKHRRDAVIEIERKRVIQELQSISESFKKNKTFNENDVLAFAANLRQLISVPKLVSYYNTKLNPRVKLNVVDYITAEDFQYIKALKTHPVLGPIANEFISNWTQLISVPARKFEQVESSLCANNPAVHLINEMKAILKEHGSPAKIKQNIEIGGMLLGSIRGFNFITAIENYHLIQMRLTAIAGALDNYLKFYPDQKPFNLDNALAIAAFHGVDPGPVQQYAKELINLTHELGQINEMISQFAVKEDQVQLEVKEEKITRPRAPRMVGKTPKAPQRTPYLIPENTKPEYAPLVVNFSDKTIPAINRAYDKARDFRTQMNEFVDFFLNPDGTLKEDSALMDGKPLTSKERLLLEEFLKPYIALADTTPIFQANEYEVAAKNYYYLMIEQSKKYTDALASCAENQASFTHFLATLAKGRKFKNDSDIKSLTDWVSLPFRYTLHVTKEVLPDLHRCVPEPTETKFLSSAATTLLRAQATELQEIVETAPEEKQDTKKLFKSKVQKIRDGQNRRINEILDKLFEDKTIDGEIARSIKILAQYGLRESNDKVGCTRANKVIEILTGLQKEKTAVARLSYLSNVSKDPEVNQHRRKLTRGETHLASHLKGLKTSLQKLEIEETKKKPMPVVAEETTSVALDPLKTTKATTSPVPEQPLTQEEIVQKMTNILSILTQAVDNIGSLLDNNPKHKKVNFAENDTVISTVNIGPKINTTTPPTLATSVHSMFAKPGTREEIPVETRTRSLTMKNNDKQEVK